MSDLEREIRTMERLVDADCFAAYMNGAIKTLFKLTQDELTKNALADIIVAMDTYRKKQAEA